MDIKLNIPQMRIIQNGLWYWLSIVKKELNEIDKENWPEEQKANHKRIAYNRIKDCNEILDLVKPLCDIGRHEEEKTEITGFKIIPCL